MEEKVLSCSFTGHRKIEPSHATTLPELLDRAIAYAYGEGCRCFYLGGAVGFDTLAAQRVMLFRMSHPDIRLCLVLPCVNQADKWSEAQRDMYDYLLGEADRVEYIAEEYFDGCMRQRNMRLAELSEIMIAYVGRSGSGAGQTMRFANCLGRRVYNLYGQK